MITVGKIGDYTVIKDGSAYYRVFRKRTRIGSFLMMDEAIKYMHKRFSMAKQPQ